MITPAAYLTKQLLRAHQVLSDPTASAARRSAARSSINRTLPVLRARLQRQPLFVKSLYGTRRDRDAARA